MSKLSFEYDDRADVMTVEGIRFSGDYFREFSDALFGDLLVVKRDGQNVYMTRTNNLPVSELLAVIFGDGGHYEQEHGTTQAIRDAIDIIIAARAKADEVTK